MKDVAKHSVTVFTCTAISEKNMASITSTTKHHGKLLTLLVAITVISLGPTIFCNNEHTPHN